MAFAGMVIVFIGFMLLGSAFFAILFGSLAISKGKINQIKSCRVFCVLACVSAIPCDLMIALAIYGAFGVFMVTHFHEIEMPDGSTTYASTSKVTQMKEIANSTDDSRIDELDELLEENPELVYYLDSANHNVLDMGAACGNYEAVETALKYGAPLDDDRYFPHTALEDLESESGADSGTESSTESAADSNTDSTADSEEEEEHDSTLEDYVSSLLSRTVTEEDIKIVKLLLDEGADTEIEWEEDYDPYSNILGKAAWAVIINDDSVTDTEVEFIQAMKDKGCEKDKQSAVVFSNGNHASEYHGYNSGVPADDNYNKVVEIVTE